MSQKRKDARFLHEHPLIAEAIEGRVKAALQFYDDKRYDWDQKTICEKAGISHSTLKKALRHRQDPTKPAVKGRGREPFLTEAAFVKLEALVTKNSLRLDAPESMIHFMALVKQVMRGEADNEYLEWNFSESLIFKLKQQFLTVAKADKKAPSRVKAFEVMRNPISLCAGLWSLFRRGQSGEKIYSSDDVSVLLNRMNDKPKMITTKAAKELLQSQNIGLSAALKEQKQRVVCFNLTISGLGCLVCKVLKFADRSFTQFNKKPKVIKMKDSNSEKMYVMLYQYGMEDAIVEEAMYRKCIEPEVLAHRQSV
jgi:hypothetical protein